MLSIIPKSRDINDTFEAFDMVRTRLSRLVSDLDEMFESRFDERDRLNPRVDITEHDNTLYYLMELPGVNVDDIRVWIVDGVLSVHGEKRREETTKDHTYRSYERSFGEFTRTFRLPDGVSSDKVEAEFDNGVLEIRIRMPAETTSATKEIKVQTGARRVEKVGSNGRQPVVA